MGCIKLQRSYKSRILYIFFLFMLVCLAINGYSIHKYLGLLFFYVAIIVFGTFCINANCILFCKNYLIIIFVPHYLFKKIPYSDIVDFSKTKVDKISWHITNSNNTYIITYQRRLLENKTFAFSTKKDLSMYVDYSMYKNHSVDNT